MNYLLELLSSYAYAAVCTFIKVPACMATGFDAYMYTVVIPSKSRQAAIQGLMKVPGPSWKSL